MGFKVECKLMACPWCGGLPEFNLPINDNQNSKGTWLWTIYCSNPECFIRPKTPHVAIRNTTKFNIEKMSEKINVLCSWWNMREPQNRFIINISFDKLKGIVNGDSKA